MQSSDMTAPTDDLDLHFEHERLDAYQRGIEFLVLADAIVADLPSGRSYLANQLQRASLSITNNIAEGCGEFAPDEKARFYRMARRSATECAALLDACQKLKLAERSRTRSGRSLLVRIVAMLTQLIRKHAA